MDRRFRELQKKLHTFQLKIKGEPSGPRFKGRLRAYQKDGHAWLRFIEDTGLGGILADDMGLGKTVQVLAYLDSRKTADKRSGKNTRRPSLVIVPKSLVFNWVQEAEKFAPHLKVVNFTGIDRAERLPQIPNSDLVVTTYQTLVRDILELKKIRFQCAIADEAQAIKNPDTRASKACRLVRSVHRMAMTGTPVENSVSDLFSIMDFASPGLLRPSARDRFEKAAQDSSLKELATLAKALRPVILRRTKAQVLKQLPKKSEQTLFCDLSTQEMRRYRQVRDYYRLNLLRKVEEEGINRSKIRILEALLRLRQLACHPGLLDRDQTAGTSSKLDALIEQVSEVTAEGHKVLVFSQFTRFLSIVRHAIEARGWSYEYLDGKTPDRQARVRRFQDDPDCRIFLVSLKAGGFGLNLTAADYVYILDPWWNPAVEAQAIDRTHRIGQSKKVFAYRLIARGTVEEKIIELQNRKRDLADAILSNDAGFLRKMTSEDLAALFS